MGEQPTTHSRHSRTLGDNLYVYAVLPRRSSGISVGVNLNPDKICNWDCVYCQVDRVTPPAVRRVNLGVLREELRRILVMASDGSLYGQPRFSLVPPELRRLADIAFAGDGEPTSYPRFDDAIRTAIEVKRETSWEALPIVVLTNGSLLDRPAVRRGLELLAGDGGEIWAKLDAGTEEYFKRVDRPRQTLARCVDLIAAEARRRPVVIQSLFSRLDGEPPGDEEIGAYVGRLRGILDAGGRIRLVQVTSVARPPAESMVAVLEEGDLEAIAARGRASVPGVPVEVYPGVRPPGGDPAEVKAMDPSGAARGRASSSGDPAAPLLAKGPSGANRTACSRRSEVRGPRRRRR
jgi:wyosine [tRNA(Phe)-imidazoG37] synthetase (radical SAM superfamily)